mgnify:CR=1 FL=1|tara:strand:+ start:2763 stop:3317 length:555 start_codon:yes stop_codon:yes gene_type:complete
MSKIDKLKSGIQASYQTNNDAKETLKKQGFKLDESLSGQRAKVYTNEQGKPHIAFRGTNNKSDVVTDIKSFLGIKNKRLEHSKKVAKDVEKKYGRPATAIGHSLGGFLAENSGVHGEVVTYNKLATGRTKKNDKQTDIRTKNDLASILTQKKKKNVTLKSKSVNPLVSHSTKSLKQKNIIKNKK